jgi:hypothetical protein
MKYEGRQKNLVHDLLYMLPIFTTLDEMLSIPFSVRSLTVSTFITGSLSLLPPLRVGGFIKTCYRQRTENALSSPDALPSDPILSLRNLLCALFHAREHSSPFTSTSTFRKRILTQSVSGGLDLSTVRMNEQELVYYV